MEHYNFFTNENERLLGKLYDVYFEFFKIKKEFVESREEFMKVLQEKFPEDYKAKNDEEGVKGKKEDLTKEENVKGDENENENVVENIRTSSLFHKIALHAHPDKHKNVHPILFDQSVKACEKGKFGKLCFLAKFMNIPFDTFTPEEIQCIQETIEKKEKKIQHYSRTYSMIYKRTNSQQIKEQLIEAFQKHK
jgi:hypothetical protein